MLAHDFAILFRRDYFHAICFSHYEENGLKAVTILEFSIHFNMLVMGFLARSSLVLYCLWLIPWRRISDTMHGCVIRRNTMYRNNKFTEALAIFITLNVVMVLLIFDGFFRQIMV